jgi:type II secretory pathway component PulF
LFARILGTLLKCGVPILTSLHAVEKALGNQIYKEALKKIREGVSRGESLSHALIKKRHLFPESIILMTDVGERSGNTGEMLEKAGVIYERDLEGTLETIVSLIQPFLVIFLGIFVVILALAMYMPLFDIIKTVK